MFTHSLKPVTQIYSFDKTRIHQLTQTFGGIVVRPPFVSERPEVIRFTQSPIEHQGRFYIALSAILDSSNQNPFIQSIPSQLKERMRQQADKVCTLSDRPTSGCLVHFNTQSTIDIGWHVDEISKYWILHQLPGERRLEIFNPKQPVQVQDCGSESLMVSNKEITCIVQQYPDRISQLMPGDDLYFTSHLAHRSGQSLNGMSYTIIPG